MKAGLILADPPWRYSYWSKGDNQRSPDRHYSGGSMTMQRLLSLPINQVAAEHCVLLLWSTNPHLESAMRYLKQHGFEYKTKIEWVKMRRADVTQQGTGYHARGVTEPLLIATKGTPRCPPPSEREPGVIFAEDPDLLGGADWEEQGGILVHSKGAHSAKPETQYAIGERYAGPHLSLFDRRYRPGWTTLGDELDGLDIEQSLWMYAESEEQLPALPVLPKAQGDIFAPAHKTMPMELNWGKELIANARE